MYVPPGDQKAMNIGAEGYPAVAALHPNQHVPKLQQQMVQTKKPVQPLKRKGVNNQQATKNLPYIKKPLNAFMLYKKEQWPLITAQQETRKSNVINMLLGQKWKALPKEEQTQYYIEAEKQKLLHSLNHPDWTCRDNYGIYKARRRTPRTTVSETSHEAKASARQKITVKVCERQTPAEQNSAFSPGLHPEHCSSEPQSVRLQQQLHTQSCSTQEGLDQSSPAPVTPAVSHSETNQDLDLWLDLILRDAPESTIPDRDRESTKTVQKDELLSSTSQVSLLDLLEPETELVWPDFADSVIPDLLHSSLLDFLRDYS
ncbi:transcription factor 7-like 1-B [Takifugu rubripes]|uniref:transcription factor 7-like 1-B n=1 Tax=Takifugu rubripes TaxID=31033 RepID=UPI0011455882|nr:transcription factor 7-like 1-B [Takifugu rubripes]